MKEPLLQPLHDDVERLLAQERNIPPASPELRARAIARAEASLRGAGARPVRTLWQRHLPQLLAAAIAVLLAVGAFAAWQRHHAVPAAPVVVGPPAEARPTPPAPDAKQPPVEALEASDAEPASAAEPKPEAKAEATAAPRRRSANDTYAVELALLQRARAAVAKGQYSAALGAIAEHQRRFPAGRLREEREALRVSALSGLGRKDEARRAAEHFRAEFPRSVLSSSIEPSAPHAP